MTQEEFDKLSEIDRVRLCVEQSLKEHEGFDSQFWKGSAHMGKSVLDAIDKIKQAPVNCEICDENKSNVALHICNKF